MKKTKQIMIGNKQVTVSEVSVASIVALLRGEQSIMAIPLTDALEKFKDLLPLALDVPLEDLLAEEIYSDDLNALFEAFKETNPVFSDTARSLNLGAALAEIIRAYIQTFSSSLLSSLRMDMAPRSGDTDTASSSI